MRTPFSSIILTAFLINSFGPLPQAQAEDFLLPKPGTMVSLSPSFNPPILKGLKVHPDNPFRFDFILDQGDYEKRGHINVSPFLMKEQLKMESTKLIKYFLASLTIPEKDLWVNLSPYEKNRIVQPSFGQTEMGRDLLAEDYMLKQITASLIYPEGETGKKFWKRIYAQAAQKFGTTNIPVNTFNKVWIVPEKAIVYENAKAGTAYVVEAKLKVMLEEDYLSTQIHQSQPGDMFNKNNKTCPQARCQAPQALNLKAPQGNPQTASPNVKAILKEIVLPELTKEVNQGQNFAQLRQVYNSLILATWYKKKIKDSILEQVYANKNKVAGILSSPNASIGDPPHIYQQYLKAFKKGVYNYIKEENDPITQQPIPRKYFSGGENFTALAMDGAMTVTSAAPLSLNSNQAMLVQAEMSPQDIPWQGALNGKAPWHDMDVLNDFFWETFYKFLQRTHYINLNTFKGRILYAAYGKSTLDLEHLSRLFPNAQITAIDWDPQAYTFQQSRLLPVNVSVVLADITDLNYVYEGPAQHLKRTLLANGSFDVALGFGFLDLLSSRDLKSAFRQVFHALKPKGLFIHSALHRAAEDMGASQGFLIHPVWGENLEVYQRPGVLTAKEDLKDAISRLLSLLKPENRERFLSKYPFNDQFLEWFLPYDTFFPSPTDLNAFLMKSLVELDRYEPATPFALDKDEQKNLERGFDAFALQLKKSPATGPVPLVIASFGIGTDKKDLIEAARIAIHRLADYRDRVQLRLVGIDKQGEILKIPLDVRSMTTDPLWQQRISYRALYGDIREKKLWDLWARTIKPNVILFRYNWTDGSVDQNDFIDTLGAYSPFVFFAAKQNGLSFAQRGIREGHTAPLTTALVHEDAAMNSRIPWLISPEKLQSNIDKLVTLRRRLTDGDPTLPVVINMGDKHGHKEDLLNVYRIARHWNGPHPLEIIIHGDVFDRGSDNRLNYRTLANFIRLNKENVKAVFILGNHEEMLLDAYYAKSAHKLDAKKRKGIIEKWLRNGGTTTLEELERGSPKFEDYKSILGEEYKADLVRSRRGARQQEAVIVKSVKDRFYDIQYDYFMKPEHELKELGHIVQLIIDNFHFAYVDEWGYGHKHNGISFDVDGKPDFNWERLMKEEEAWNEARATGDPVKIDEVLRQIHDFLWIDQYNEIESTFFEGGILNKHLLEGYLAETGLIGFINGHEIHAFKSPLPGVKSPVMNVGGAIFGVDMGDGQRGPDNQMGMGGSFYMDPTNGLELKTLDGKTERILSRRRLLTQLTDRIRDLEDLKRDQAMRANPTRRAVLVSAAGLVTSMALPSGHAMAAEDLKVFLNYLTARLKINKRVINAFNSQKIENFWQGPERIQDPNKFIEAVRQGTTAFEEVVNHIDDQKASYLEQHYGDPIERLKFEVAHLVAINHIAEAKKKVKEGNDLVAQYESRNKQVDQFIEQLVTLFNALSLKMQLHQGIKVSAGRQNAAMATADPLGGIDLNPAQMNLQVNNNASGALQFHIDPAQLARLQNVSGFVPVVVNIQPMHHLREFLGLNG